MFGCFCCGARVRRRGGAHDHDDDDDEEKIPIVEQPTATSAAPASSTVPPVAVALHDGGGSVRGSAGETDDLTRGKRLFNVSPEKGIRFLQSKELVGTTPAEVAAFLRESLFLDRSKIGDYISNPGPFYEQLLQCFVDSQSFTNLEFDQALRKLLEGFRLPGEAQKIDRVMEKFARTYCAANPGVFASTDTAYILAFSLIMLNTDLHNPNIKNRMTKEAFIKNNRGINGGQDLPFEMLSHLYDSFKRKELQMDEGMTYEDTSYTFFNPEREGTLWKLNSNMRGWNRRFFVVTGNCLYYFKNQEDKDPSGIIPLEDLSVREVDLSGVLDFDTSPKYCFELYDANREGNPKATIKAVKRAGGTLSRANHTTYIFAADSPEERTEWVKCIRTNMAPPPIFSLMDKRRKLMQGGGSGAGAGGSKGASGSSSSVSGAGEYEKIGTGGKDSTRSARSTHGQATSLATMFMPLKNETKSQANLVANADALSPVVSPRDSSASSFSGTVFAGAQALDGTAGSSPRSIPTKSGGSVSLPAEAFLSRSSSGSSLGATAPHGSVEAPSPPATLLATPPRRASGDSTTSTPAAAAPMTPAAAAGATPLNKMRANVGTPPSAVAPRVRQGHNRSVSDTSALAPTPVNGASGAQRTAAGPPSGPASGPMSAGSAPTVPLPSPLGSGGGLATRSASTDGMLHEAGLGPATPRDTMVDTHRRFSSGSMLSSLPRVPSSLRSSSNTDEPLAAMAGGGAFAFGESEQATTTGPGSDVTNEVLANVLQRESSVAMDTGTPTDSPPKTRHSKDGDDTELRASLLASHPAGAVSS